jgi:hypothetical protein
MRRIIGKTLITVGEVLMGMGIGLVIFGLINKVM